ncbi:hypothetical protein [Dactylosporangium sp. NPDC000521]|uniref:hypothetical protein n=1 Tax=Dactylosporangium sp. NPDC000521 TaxID=3363975 RepID=UPI0036D05D82
MRSGLPRQHMPQPANRLPRKVNGDGGVRVGDDPEHVLGFHVEPVAGVDPAAGGDRGQEFLEDRPQLVFVGMVQAR